MHSELGFSKQIPVTHVHMCGFLGVWKSVVADGFSVAKFNLEAPPLLARCQSLLYIFPLGPSRWQNVFSSSPINFENIGHVKSEINCSGLKVERSEFGALVEVGTVRD